MGFNLRRSKKLMPGVRVNLSKKGLGLSVGPTHAKVSISPSKKITTNLGVPETGLRYTSVTNSKKSKAVKETEIDAGQNEIPATDVPSQDAFLNSRFNTDPGSLSDWSETNADYQELLRCVELAVAGKSNKTVASEFPAKAKEVVFLKVTSVLTDDSNKKLDTGSAYLTNQRVVFMGLKKTTEWKFKTMSIFLPFDAQETALFQNTDHENVRGIKLLGEDWFKFQLFLTMAYALNKYPAETILEQMNNMAGKYAAARPRK